MESLRVIRCLSTVRKRRLYGKKKITLTVVVCSLLSIIGLTSYKLIAKDKYEHRSLSKSEIIEMTVVTDEEKVELQELGINYDEILDQARKDEKELFETHLSHDKDRKLLFLADGGMTTGLTDYNDVLHKTVATYDSETDTNAVTYEEAIELLALKDARNDVNRYLGLPVNGE